MVEISITLGRAYYCKGYINIPVAYDHYFNENNNAPLLIFLSSWIVNPIEGAINRTDNPNRSPRIRMGTIYTGWVQANHQIGQNITVTFNDSLHPNSMLIQ